MRDVVSDAQNPLPCPLCGSRVLTPAFDPPLVRCRACGLVFRNQEGAQEQVRGGFGVIYGDPRDEHRIQERRRPLYQEFLARYPPLPGAVKQGESAARGD